MEKAEQFKYIEDLLFQYKKTQNKILTMEESVRNIDDIILKQASTLGGSSGSSSGYKSDIEKKEEIKEKTLEKIEEYKKLTRLTEKLLLQIEDDKYYRVIELKYLERKKNTEISEILEIALSTVITQKKRIIEELAGTVFLN